jgi:hypothetical protein
VGDQEGYLWIRKRQREEVNTGFSRMRWMDTLRELSPAIQVRVRLQIACLYAAADVSAAFAQCQYSASYHGSELATG